MDSIDTSGASRATVTRKELLRLGAALFGGAAVAGLVGSPAVHAGGGGDGRAVDRTVGRWAHPDPSPVAWTNDFDGFVPSNPSIHAFAPAVGLDMSTITDFKGVVAACELQGGAQQRRSIWSTPTCASCKAPMSIYTAGAEHTFGFV